MTAGQPVENFALATSECSRHVDAKMLADNPNYNPNSHTLDERVKRAELDLQCARISRAAVVAKETNAQQQLLAREVTQQEVAAKEQAAKEVTSEQDFLGLNWGIGVGYSFASKERISSAEIVNGVVRATTSAKSEPRVFMEFHKYIWCHAKDEGTRGCGPFVAVAATSDKLLSGVAMGFMYGLKAKKDDKDGFSVGAGVVLDAKVKDLASGFEKDQPPPAGETTVRIEEKNRWSGVLFVTRTF
jgi:hypothetical protein